MRDLLDANTAELKQFFNSFDYVLSDVDGVLWHFTEKIPGTQDAIKSLQKLGKKVILVSNNTTKPFQTFYQQLRDADFDIGPKDLVIPTLVMTSYLKKHHFSDKQIFLIGMTPLQKALEESGFKIAPKAPRQVAETVDAHILQDDESIGCVIADVDANLNYLDLQKAVTFLKRPDVLFLKGPPDCELPIGGGRTIMGPGVFLKVLEESSKRKGISMAKPSPFLDEYIVESFGIKERERVLFIGDSIPSDMSFAAESKYKKLLVLSGTTKKEDLKNWIHPENYKPDYYAESLKTVYQCINRILGVDNQEKL